MASYNRVVLLGNLTRDPELRYLASGMAVADIGLAVNDRRKNASGEWVDETTFVDVTLWGRTAEVAGEYLSKGSPVLIEGRLKLDSWETQDGQKRSKLKVVGERMQMVGARGQGGGEGGGPRRAAKPDTAFSQAAPPDEVYDAPPAEPSGGDDIPF
jgi:single-strand DNA-binding protein